MAAVSVTELCCRVPLVTISQRRGLDHFHFGIKAGGIFSHLCSWVFKRSKAYQRHGKRGGKFCSFKLERQKQPKSALEAEISFTSMFNSTRHDGAAMIPYFLQFVVLQQVMLNFPRCPLHCCFCDSSSVSGANCWWHPKLHGHFPLRTSHLKAPNDILNQLLCVGMRIRFWRCDDHDQKYRSFTVLKLQL